MSIPTTVSDASDTPDVGTAGFVVSGLVLLVAVTLLLKLRLVFVLGINWDEFFYLSHIHQYLRGELVAQFQVYHVHLFAWLPLVADGEVSQIIAARLVMYGLGLGSCAFTYLIARRFLNTTGALFAVLAYLAISNVVEHGTSFRSDPIGAFLFLAALCLLFYRPGAWRAAVGAGLLMALSVMVTIKAAIHLASIAAVLLIFLGPADRRRREALVQITAFGVAFVIGFALLYGLHRISLPAAAADQAKFALATADKMFLAHGFLPRGQALINHLGHNPIVWGLMVNGLVLVAFDAVRRRDGASRQLLVFGAFFIPLLSVLFYRNAHPYYYVFILSPAVVVSGIVVDRLVPMFQGKGRRWALAEVVVFAGITFASFVVHYQMNAADGTIAQRQIAKVVHEIFPDPVPYIDGPSMIATFPQVGFFMSTWGMEAYRDTNRPVLATAVAEHSPVFLLLNQTSLLDAMSGTRHTQPEHVLLKADQEALARNYIPHWGNIYVAGKTLEFATPAPKQFDILIAGTYTMEGDESVVIDGEPYAPEQSVHLARGRHMVTPGAALATVTLRWGKRLFRPAEAPSKAPMFPVFR